MPKYRRHFPVNQRINLDPEMWELTNRFGDRALRVWLEILSMGERADGELPNLSPEVGRVLAYCCRVSRQTSASVWRYAEEMLWITQTTPPRIAKYWEYHKRREPNENANEEQTGSLRTDRTNHTNHKEEDKKKKETAPPVGFADFWQLYPKKKSPGDAEKAWKALTPDADLRDTIGKAVMRWRGSLDWLKDGGQFIPYPATWLRARGWEDELPKSAGRVVPHTPKVDEKEEMVTPEQAQANREKLRQIIGGIK